MEPPGDDGDPDKKKAAEELARQELEASKRVQTTRPTDGAYERNLAAWNQRQDERLEVARRDAARQQHMKLHDPDEYQRDMKERQRRAERDAAQQVIKAAPGGQGQAIGKQQKTLHTDERGVPRWTNELSDYARAAVAATEKADRDARDGPSGHERKGR